jgi:hypothetical protein
MPRGGPGGPAAGLQVGGTGPGRRLGLTLGLGGTGAYSRSRCSVLGNGGSPLVLIWSRHGPVGVTGVYSAPLCAPPPGPHV